MRIAAKAKRLSRKMLEQCTELFTVDTIMRWYQKLIAEKYDGSHYRTSPGRPKIDTVVVDLVIRFKKENPRWGYKKQVARILTDYGGFLKAKRYLIHDRGPLYNTKGFHDILRTSGIEPVKLPAQSPDLDAYSERFVKSVKYECLNHLILSSVQQLEYVLEQYCQYYHHERIHQSLGRIIEPKHNVDDNAEIQCIERLGGLLKSYHRLAA